MRKGPQKPSYLYLTDREFESRIKKAKKILGSCSLCANDCGVDRFKKPGLCGIGGELKIASVNLHYGEEPPISGERGSGTVFLSGCCLSCVFCQNYPISQFRNGSIMSASGLAAKMVELEKRGAHNINFVSPTHQVPQIIEAVYAARKMGLKIPLVYNTGGYDSLDCLKLTDGIMDIYLPDFKYYGDGNAKKYSGASDYLRTALSAIKEMHRQAGNLKVDRRGVATRGVMIRHLVLPKNIAGTEKIFALLKNHLPLDIFVSVMGQYFPAHRAGKYGLKRKVTDKEYVSAIKSVLRLGFSNLYKQEDMDGAVFLPKIELASAKRTSLHGG